MMTTRYFASNKDGGTVTEIDMSGDPDFIEIDYDTYMMLVNGILYENRMIWIDNGVAKLRAIPPAGEPVSRFEYIEDGDFWKRLPPADYDGTNYEYNPATNRWDWIEPEEPQMPEWS